MWVTGVTRSALRILMLVLLAVPAMPGLATAQGTAGAPQEIGPVAGDNQESEEIGVDERLGEQVPLDLGFTSSSGQQVSLGELLTKPTVVLPIYYTCPTACPIMLGNLAEAINQVPLELGEQYRVLAISFNPADGPEQATEAKENYGSIVTAEAADHEWLFLTGDQDAITAFTGAIGFRYKQTNEHMFMHPNVMVALAPDGTIIRYLYGPRFLPFDIGMAVTEAAAGTPGLSVRKLLNLCFSYEPTQRTYVFRSFRLVAAVIILALVGFFIVILRRRPDSDRQGAPTSAGNGGSQQDQGPQQGKGSGQNEQGQNGQGQE